MAIEGKGSSTAPPALIEGTAQFGPMSREMKSKEIDDFEKKFGYKPSVVRTAVDSLAVFVHKDNPIKCLTLQQIDAIFSKSRKGGAAKDVKTWGDLGLTGEWADKPISLYGRNSPSGTLRVLQGSGALSRRLQGWRERTAGSSAVVQGVASDKYASGIRESVTKPQTSKQFPLQSRKGNASRPMRKTPMPVIIPLPGSCTFTSTRSRNNRLIRLWPNSSSMSSQKKDSSLLSRTASIRSPKPWLTKT